MIDTVSHIRGMLLNDNWQDAIFLSLLQFQNTTSLWYSHDAWYLIMFTSPFLWCQGCSKTRRNPDSSTYTAHSFIAGAAYGGVGQGRITNDCDKKRNIHNPGAHRTKYRTYYIDPLLKMRNSNSETTLIWFPGDWKNIAIQTWTLNWDKTGVWRSRNTKYRGFTVSGVQ